MSFHVGQKVVLFTHEVPKSAKGQLGKNGGSSVQMAIGSVWTIRDIDTRYIKHYGFPALRFEEHVGPTVRVVDYGNIESGFPAPCFRPVAERKASTKTGMSILRMVAADASTRRNLVVTR